ncbi:hypothetical protein [Albidovulum sp.]|nr:hypothetical protein [Paracoccaceae bacterium]MCC0045212.1 hypothetical protein [Defluviimonas sp.]HPE25109.1 hypothetical protein [Albidovulum sp.]MCB2120710.1 hypothetical protein [Paracoccaceae bacterium]MCB2122142.1 hypothetical protein [Paracoccaceae bacterium]
MLIGFFLRRIVTFALCAGAFWLGMKTDRMIQVAPTAAPCEEASDGN